MPQKPPYPIPATASPCSPGKNWTLLVGRAPVTPGLTERVPASPMLPPASPTKVPFSSGGEEPSAASAAALRQEPAPRRRGRAAPPGMQRASRQKEPVGAGAAPCRALAPTSVPKMGPAPANGSLQMDRQLSAGLQCLAFPTG